MCGLRPDADLGFANFSLIEPGAASIGARFGSTAFEFFFQDIIFLTVSDRVD